MVATEGPACAPPVPTAAAPEAGVCFPQSFIFFLLNVFLITGFTRDNYRTINPPICGIQSNAFQGKFTGLCIHQHNPILEHSHHPQRTIPAVSWFLSCPKQLQSPPPV